MLTLLFTTSATVLLELLVIQVDLRPEKLCSSVGPLALHVLFGIKMFEFNFNFSAPLCFVN